MSIITLVLLIELSGAEGFQEFYEPSTYENTKYYDFTTYITMGAKVYFFDLLYIEGSIKAVTNLLKGKFSSDISGLSSFIEIGLEYNGFSIGYRHFCTHPIIPYFKDAKFLRFYDEMGNEFFIRFETDKIKLF